MDYNSTNNAIDNFHELITAILPQKLRADGYIIQVFRAYYFVMAHGIRKVHLNYV